MDVYQFFSFAALLVGIAALEVIFLESLLENQRDRKIYRELAQWVKEQQAKNFEIDGAAAERVSTKRFPLRTYTNLVSNRSELELLVKIIRKARGMERERRIEGRLS